MSSPSSPARASESMSPLSLSDHSDVVTHHQASQTRDFDTASRSHRYLQERSTSPQSAPASVTDISHRIHTPDHGASRHLPASTSPRPTPPGDGTVPMHFNRPSSRSRSKQGPIAVDMKRLLSKPALPSSSRPTEINFKQVQSDTEAIQPPRAKKFLYNGPSVSANPSRESFLLRAASLPTNVRLRKGMKMHPVLQRRQNSSTYFEPIAAAPLALPSRSHATPRYKFKEGHSRPKISSPIPLKDNSSRSPSPPTKLRAREERNSSSDDEAGVYYTVLGQLDRQNFNEGPATVAVPEFRRTGEAATSGLGGLARKFSLSGKLIRAASLGRERRRPRTLRRQRSLPSPISREDSASASPPSFRGLTRQISTDEMRTKSRNQASPPVPAFPAELSKDGRAAPTKFLARLMHANQSVHTRHLPQRKPIPSSPLPAAPAAARTCRRRSTTPISSSPYSDTLSTRKSHSASSSMSSLGEELQHATILSMEKHIVPPAELYRLGLDPEGENVPLSSECPLLHRIDKGVYEILTPLPAPPRTHQAALVTEPDSHRFSFLDADDIWEKSVSAVARHFESEPQTPALPDHSPSPPPVPAKSRSRPNLSRRDADADSSPSHRRVLRKKRSLGRIDRSGSLRSRPGSTWSDTEKAKRWDDLLELSAKAGGTLHLGLAEGMNLDSDKMSDGPTSPT